MGQAPQQKLTLSDAIDAIKKVPNPYHGDLSVLKQFAIDNNLILIQAAKEQVLVDIDSPSLPKDFGERMKMIHEQEPIARYGVSQSRGGNLHVIVEFRHGFVAGIEKLLYESVLGGDYKRVLLGLKGTHALGDLTSVFFEKPDYKIEWHSVDKL
jgi:hypothetical protein